jgi:hypothetical protein
MGENLNATDSDMSALYTAEQAKLPSRRATRTHIKMLTAAIAICTILQPKVN